MTDATPATELSYEDALAELEQIVSELERGETALEDTIARFERGVVLSRRCEDRLNEAEKKVALLLREGRRLVQVDLQTGEQLDSRPLPDAAGEQPAPTVEDRPEREEKPRPAEAQRPLILDHEDDIPF